VAGDPVAWRVIEQGWRVVDAEGNVVGYVDQITGDLNEEYSTASPSVTVARC
jgi:rRNA processing protein Gar1